MSAYRHKQYPLEAVHQTEEEGGQFPSEPLSFPSLFSGRRDASDSPEITGLNEVKGSDDRKIEADFSLEWSDEPQTLVPLACNPEEATVRDLASCIPSFHNYTPSAEESQRETVFVSVEGREPVINPRNSPRVAKRTSAIDPLSPTSNLPSGSGKIALPAVDLNCFENGTESANEVRIASQKPTINHSRLTRKRKVNQQLEANEKWRKVPGSAKKYGADCQRRRIPSFQKATAQDSENINTHGAVAAPAVTFRYSENAPPSKYCHTCGRNCIDSKIVEFTVCGNNKKGMCKKIVCKKCLLLHDHLVDWSGLVPTQKVLDMWTCTHCRAACPVKARCTSYQRNNEKRKLLNCTKKDSKPDKPITKERKLLARTTGGAALASIKPLRKIEGLDDLRTRNRPLSFQLFAPIEEEANSVMPLELPAFLPVVDGSVNYETILGCMQSGRKSYQLSNSNAENYLGELSG